jgi:hypothetical protein
MSSRERKWVWLWALSGAVAGATVAFFWMHMASAAIAYGVSFPASWSLAAYISCPAIALFSLHFWLVTIGNAMIYAGFASIMQRIIQKWQA